MFDPAMNGLTEPTRASWGLGAVARGVWRLAAGYRVGLALSLSLAAFLGALAAAAPSALLQGLADPSGASAATVLGVALPIGWLGLAVALLLLSMVCEWVFALFDHSLRARWEVSLKLRIFEALLVDPAAQGRRSLGERSALLTRLPSQLVFGADTVFKRPLEVASMLAGILLTTTPEQRPFVAYVVPVLVILFIVLPRWVGLPRRNQEAVRELQGVAGDEATVLQEQLDATDHLEGCGLQETASRRLRERAERFKRTERWGLKLGLIQGSLGSVALLALPLLALSFHDVASGLVSGGGVLLILYQRLQGAMEGVGNWTQDMQRLAIATEGIQEELGRSQRTMAAPPLRSAERIDLGGVSITLPNGKRLLEGLECSFRRGELHVICGPGGRGKSVLLDVLAGRFGGAVEGRISCDGTVFSWNDWRARSSSVYRISQVPRLFRMTAREFIDLGCVDPAGKARAQRVYAELLSPEHAEVEARVVPLSDVIGGDRRLSGFQGQALRLAQVAALPTRAITCFDEPDSSMSADDAAQIQAILAREFARDSLTFVASHRPGSFPPETSRIWFLASDRILVGSHAELLASSAEYREYNQVRSET